MVTDGFCTVMVGFPLATFNVRGPALPVLSAHVWLGVVSAKLRWPMVRAPSRVTVELFVRSRVAKLAVVSAALATMLPCQLDETGQLPPAAFAHVGVAKTVRLRVASSESPQLSVVRTTKLLFPRSPAAGDSGQGTRGGNGEPGGSGDFGVGHGVRGIGINCC